MPKRGEIYWVNLDPTVGCEIKKTRPGLIISNDVQNRIGIVYIIAPITSQIEKIYPFEVKLNIKDKPSKAMLDQIRTVDAKRLGTLITHITKEEQLDVDKAIKLVLSVQ